MRRTDGGLSAAGCVCVRVQKSGFVCVLFSENLCPCFCECACVCVGVCVRATELRRGTVGLPSPDGAGTQTQLGWQRWHAQPSHSWLCQPPCSPPCSRLGLPAASSLASPTDRRTGRLAANLLAVPQLVWRCLIQHTIQRFTMQQTHEMNARTPPAFRCTQLDRNCVRLPPLFHLQLLCLNFIARLLNRDVS